VREHVGGYSDWLRRRVPEASPAPARRPAAAAESPPAPPTPGTRRKLSYKEQRELDGLPAVIEALEQEIAAIHAAMAGPDYYRQSADVLAGDRRRLDECEQRLAAAFARWEELEPPGGG
jgi:ATP-binding cassette subfamily F protein uup